ncbi:MAG TPA: hypothetical protein VKT28_00855 [Puia sp.]|nr:hypothetical protein [Puia sp.]
MQEEKIMTEQESLRLISRTIYEAKGYYYESGMSALMYGFSVFVCSILCYLRDEKIIAFPFHPFYLLIPVFFVLGWAQMKEDKKKKAKTFTDEAIDYVWMGFMLSALAAFAAGFAGLYYISIAIVLILISLATFLTGMIAKFKYHIVCSFIGWALAIVSFFILNPNIYLLLAFDAVMVWVIPGFMLRAAFKKIHGGE